MNPDRPIARDVTDESGPPCIGQDQVTVNQAAADQTFTVMIPTTDLANSSLLSDVCAAEGGGVAMIFSSGLELRESPNDLRDPVETWNAIVDAYPEAGYELTTIHGQAAIQVAPGGEQPSLGGVVWVEDGVKYEIKGNGRIALADLLALPDSLQPYMTPAPSPSAPIGPTG
jgi:hypothetical protein